MTTDWDRALAEETDADGSDDEGGRLVTPLRVLVGLVVLASFGVWVYAFSGLPPSSHPDVLDDTAFPLAAEPRCAEFRAWLDAEPLAINAVNANERANDIDEATDRLAGMVDDLESMITGTARDIQILNAWVADYRVFIEDRRRYASALRDDPEAPFQLTPKEGRQITRPVDNLATVNKMLSCETPSDV